LTVAPLGKFLRRCERECRPRAWRTQPSCGVWWELQLRGISRHDEKVSSSKLSKTTIDEEKIEMRRGSEDPHWGFDKFGVEWRGSYSLLGSTLDHLNFRLGRLPFQLQAPVTPVVARTAVARLEPWKDKLGQA